MKLKHFYLYIVLGTIIVLSACNGVSTQEEMYKHLEESVQLEKEFEELQSQIVALEEEEQEIYNQISELGKDEIKKIQKLAQKAIGSIKNRTDLIVQERESVKASQAEFEKVEKLVDELEEQEVKDKAQEMYLEMMDRYEAYEKLHVIYMETLKQEEELYQLFQNDEIDQDELLEKITVINGNYEKFLTENEKFNDHTVAYNALKEEFYNVAGLDVEFED